MNKLMMRATALAVCLGSSAALAQDSDKTTTTVSTPAGTTETTTTTTKSDDGYAQYRRTVTSTRHYDAGAFLGPSGYIYTRYSVGQRAPAILLGDRYALEHYAAYGLGVPPIGLTWIRVGNDALLIDESNGEIVQAEYGLFKG
jgi:Ni/Co efflux regulator RcnB